MSMIQHLKVRTLIASLIILNSGQAIAYSPNDDLNCMLEPNTEIELSASVYGVLSDVHVQRGDKVKRGQVLARLVSGAEKAAVKLAKARVEFGQRKSIRSDDLYKKELISIHEKDEMDTEIEISKLQLMQAEAELKLKK